MKFRNIVAVIAIQMAMAAEPEGAPSNAAKAPAAKASTAPGSLKIGKVTVSGSLRSRIEGFDWFEPASGNNAYAYSGNLFRLSFAQKLENWEWNAEFAVPILLGMPSDSSVPGAQGALGAGANYFAANGRRGNRAMIFPKQLYVRLTPFGGAGQSLKLGRFEFLDGSELAPKNATLAAVKNSRVAQRLLGNFGWTNVGRSFDGLHYSYTKSWGNFTFVSGVPTRGVFQVDGWGWNRTAFGYAAVTLPWGSGTHSADTRLFALFYDDFRPVVKSDNRPAGVRATDFANIKLWTFGGHSLHAVNTSAGPVDLLLWGAGQSGKWGMQNHLAHAINLEAGYQPKILPKLRPWLRAGFYDGSGDGNANDDRHETFFQVLPTPRPFARFPFFNMMNNRDTFATLMLRPHTRITITNEFHALRLSNKNDLWYLGGGVFQPWTFGYAGRASGGRQSLANLYDANLEYRMNPHVTFTAYWGYAQGLAAAAGIYPKGKDGSFGYGEVMYRF